MKNILIIGFGNMGTRYAKYLDSFGIRWHYYDPCVIGGLKKLSNLNEYSHIIISTPSEFHYDSYNSVIDSGFSGSIYIDKPVVISDKHLDILNNENVFVG